MRSMLIALFRVVVPITLVALTPARQRRRKGSIIQEPNIPKANLVRRDMQGPTRGILPVITRLMPCRPLVPISRSALWIRRAVWMMRGRPAERPGVERMQNG